MKKLIFCALTILSLVTFGQAPALPKIVPPSPEVAMLMKANLSSTSLHTGAASVSVPIFEMTAGSIKVPISINYNSNGIKVDEIPSRVGLGWSLNAGGVISRTIHDEPDGLYTALTPPADPTIHNQQLLDYLVAATGTNNFDTEPDEFNFSFPGGSGKFYIDNVGVPHCFPHTNLKIAMGGTAAARLFTIITSDGTKYFFGYNNSVEKTSSVTVNGGVTRTEPYETGWFLTSIVSVSGDQVNFSYTPIAINTIQGCFQTLIKPVLPLNQNNTQCQNGNYTCTYSEATGLNGINYNTCQLNAITTNSGLKAAFSYQARPDASGDTRLTGVGVSTGDLTTGFTLIKQFGIEFDDNAVNTLPTNGNNSLMNKRYFLKSVKQLSLNAGDPTLNYDFSYLNQMSMPPRLSYAQDYFGYYNGANSNTYFAPFYNQPLSDHSTVGADRTPNGTVGQYGLLQRITYPTGGFEEFTYEPQTIGFNELANTTNTIVLTGNGDGTNLLHTYNVNTLLVKKTHTSKLAISASENLATPNSPAPDGSTLVRVKVLDGATILIDRSLNSYTGEVYDVPLSANKIYTIQLNVWGQTHTGRADLIYDTAATDVYVWSNKDVGGQRVRKISSYDPVSNKWLNKYYTYASRTDLTKSSGVGAYKTDFVKPYLTGYSCDVGQASTIILNCDNYMVSSSLLFPYYSYSGSHVAYTNVIEGDDANFVNGGTEHYFQTAGGTGIIQQLLGPSSEPGGSPNPTAMQGVPQNTVTDINGTEWKTVVFKNSAGQFIPLKEVVNSISYDSRINNQTFGYVARKRWAYPYHYIPPVEEEFRGYDLVKYAFVSYWPHLDYTTVTDYDQNGQNPQVTTTTYTYSSINHLASTKVETLNSKQEIMGTITKYPEDFAFGNDVYTAMLQKGITTTPVEQIQSKGTKLISDTKTDFKDWLNNQSVLMPEVINTQKGSATAEARIRYYGYDATANTLEVSKESGAHISYIWDYWNNFPIAEVQNASYTNIAYTSFEADGKGRWIFTGAPVVDAATISGKKDYVLSNGPITRDLLTPATTYMVTYWSKSGQVASVGGTVRTLMTIAPWVLYEHTISGVSSVTLSGTVTIDELRLYPKGAFMTTNCYEPYVGTSSTCSANNAFTYYEYDGFKRLLLIRDSRKNILKQYDYKYGQQIVPCANSTPSWQPTGNYQCVKDATNNNTGEQMREEMDMNNCSSSYLKTHWVSNGTSSQCPVAPPCIGQDKRIVNGVCETGVKITTGSIKLTKTQWQCTFHYVWSDGFVGPDLTEISSTPCLVAQ